MGLYYNRNKNTFIGIESAEEFASAWDEYKHNKNNHINIQNYNEIKEMEYDVLTDINKAISDDKIFKAKEVAVPTDLKNIFPVL